MQVERRTLLSACVQAPCSVVVAVYGFVKKMSRQKTSPV